MRALKLMAGKLDVPLKIVAWDYARKIKSLDDVPKLLETLHAMKQASEGGQVSGRLLIDSYSRLFRAAMPETQSALWDALLEYEDYIRDVRTRKSLTELSRDMALLVKTGNMPNLEIGRATKTRSAAARKAQTSDARAHSISVRNNRARQAARELQKAFDDFKEDIPGASLKAFIDSDASNAVRNSLGRPWAYSSAKRALRDLRNSEQ